MLRRVPADSTTTSTVAHGEPRQLVMPLRHAAPDARKARSRDTAAWITAVATAWIAVMLTAIVVILTAAGVAVKTHVQENVASARSYIGEQRPRAEAQLDRVSQIAQMIEEALFSEQNKRAYAAVARRSPLVADLVDRALSDESIERYRAAYERARIWEERAEALYNDRRIAVMARAATDVSNAIETRGAELMADVERVLNVSHTVVRRAAHRMHALEAVLS